MIAYSIAGKLRSGDVLALKGDLASGKTTFTQGLSDYFEVEEDVTSPTFTLINEYQGKIPIYHLDCYRIYNVEELLMMGFEDYLNRDGIVIIEWPEIVEKLLPEETTIIDFKYGPAENERIINIQSMRKFDF